MSYRIPIVLWQDAQGNYHARTAELIDSSTAFGRSPSEVRQQLKDYFAAKFRDRDWFDEPDFHDLTLLRIAVPVRPRLEKGNRVHLHHEAIELPVDCIVGKRENGLPVCSIPLLELEFDFHKTDNFKQLAVEHVRSRLDRMSVSELVRLQPPNELQLDEITVRVKPRSRSIRLEDMLPHLSAVGSPMGVKTFRGRVSRALLREGDIRELVQRLHAERASVLLVGERGVGKTAILVDAVREIEREAKKDKSRDEIRQTHWHTTAARLIAGMQYLGQWQERLEDVIAELAGIDGVLCASDLSGLVETGGCEPQESLAAFIMPYLQSGELRMVCEATPEELIAARRMLPGFVDCFQHQRVRGFDEPEAIKVLNRLVTARSEELRTPVEADFPSTTYRLHKRFLPYRAFPGSAVSFVETVFERAVRDRDASVTARLAREEFAARTGLSETFLRDDLPLDPEEIFRTLSRRVIGQDAACRLATDVIAGFKSAVNDPARPIGVLLFCGPTGVGKTELAKAAAEFLFGHGQQPNRLVRIDCSEYGGYGAADRLLRKPDGSPGVLIDRVRRQPFTVLLLDEVEKAAEEVFDVLLNVMEEGKLSDRFGRTTLFRSALIVMTSNLGAGSGESIGFAGRQSPRYEKEVLSFFRPEFVNRLDALATFDPLSPEVIERITRKELAELESREGIAAKGLRLDFDPLLVARVAAQGFDERYGARPLQRYIAGRVMAPLARYLVEHHPPRGSCIMLRWNPETELVEIHYDNSSASRSQ